MDQYDTKSLNILKVVIDEKSRTKAAARLKIKGSTLHYHLEKLRKQTNDKLIDTIDGEARPTFRGKRLYDAAKKIQSILRDELNSDTVFDYTEENRTFTIFCNDYFASIVAPYLIEKSTTLGKSINFKFYVIPDLDESQIGLHLREFYHYLLRNESIDLLIISDTTKIDFPDLKRVKILQTDIAPTVSLVNQTVFESTDSEGAGEYPEIAYLDSGKANSISSYLAIAHVIKNTLHWGKLPSEILEENSDLQADGDRKKLSMYQYWHQSISDNKSHSWLRKFVKSSCKELLLVK